MSDMAVRLQPHRFTVADYHRAAAAGVFEGARVELLDGIIVDVSPIGPRHVRREAIVHAYLVRVLGERAFVSGNGSFAVDERNEPQPDIALLDAAWLDDAKGDMSARDLLAAIEISVSSLAVDLGRKAELYAEAGVPDYLVVDVEGERLIRHRDPHGGRYRDVTLVAAGTTFRLGGFPDDLLAADVFLGRSRG